MVFFVYFVFAQTVLQGAQPAEKQKAIDGKNRVKQMPSKKQPDFVPESNVGK